MEKFCLKWNDFQTNVSKSFKFLRKENDFYDVTLVSDDQKQMSAHKLVLSACSEYFRNILKQSKQAIHPYLCLEGVSSSDLSNIMDYIYNGELQIYQDDLDRFLAVAQRFQLEGLIGNEKDEDKNQFNETNESISENFEVPSNNHTSYNIGKKYNKLDLIENEHTPTVVSNEKSLDSRSQDKPLTVISPDFSNTQELDQKLEEYFYRDQDGLFKCCQCGKECKSRGHILEHVEIHVDNLSFPCQLCDKTFRSRNARKIHIWRHNKKC